MRGVIGHARSGAIFDGGAHGGDCFGDGHAVIVYGGARHDDVCARAHDARRVLRLDAAVDLQFGGEAEAVYRGAEAFHLRKNAGDERLPAEAGVDGHDEDEVQLRQYLAECAVRRGWVERDAGGRTEVANLVNGAVQVRHSLLVHRDLVRPCGDEVRDEAFRLHDHQVHVQREARVGAYRLDDERADGEVRDETPVHDVDVDVVRAGLLGLADDLTDAGEVRREDGGREFDISHGMPPCAR